MVYLIGGSADGRIVARRVVGDGALVGVTPRLGVDGLDVKARVVFLLKHDSNRHERNRHAEKPVFESCAHRGLIHVLHRSGWGWGLGDRGRCLWGGGRTLKG